MLGVIYGPNGKVCYTMEPPWRDNRSNVSCIPPREYGVKYLKKSATGKYRDCYWITNVPERLAILCHKGNLVTDTMGCILPGMKLGTLGGRSAVLNSRGGLRALHKITGRQEYILDVRNDFKILR